MNPQKNKINKDKKINKNNETLKYLNIRQLNHKTKSLILSIKFSDKNTFHPKHLGVITSQVRTQCYQTLEVKVIHYIKPQRYGLNNYFIYQTSRV